MKNKIILFGAGYYGEIAYKELHRKHKIVCFADNNEMLVGKTIENIPVILGENILEYYDNETDIVISSSFYYEISNQLYNKGLTKFYIMLDGCLYENQECGKFRPRKRCSRCVMDNDSDEMILFNEHGQCNYCTSALKNIGKIYYPNEKGKRKLNDLISQIKDEGKDKKYDCVMGLSGGLDSSYLAYLGSTWGLRILTIHIDDGYDTEISKGNLAKLVSATGFDYEVVCPDAEQFNDLTLSYMKAGVPNIDIPQDNILFAFIYKKMKEYNIKYFLAGHNFALECILQRGNIYKFSDVVNIMDIHNRFGGKPIDKLEFLSTDQYKIDREKLGILSPTPLDYIDYNRDRAFKELKEFCGFEYYGRKHLENILTAFIQLYWFPKKFNVDKRTSHLSSMIVSGQMTRGKALELLEEPLYDEDLMNEYISIIKNNMHISDEEFEAIMNAPTHQHNEYRTE